MCVPGTVKAFFELQKRYGRLQAKDLLLAVARRAEEGAILTQYEADCLNRLGPKLAVSPEARRIYVRAEPFQAGDVLPNAALARTFETLAREGEAAFYRGRIAEQIVADLARQRRIRVAPRTWPATSSGNWSPSPWTWRAAGLDRAARSRRGHAAGDPGHPGPARLSPVPSAARPTTTIWPRPAKMAFIDRLDYLGDLPLEGNPTYRDLLTRAYGERLFGLIDPVRDTPTDVLAERIRAGRRGPGRDARAEHHPLRRHRRARATRYPTPTP